MVFYCRFGALRRIVGCTSFIDVSSYARCSYIFVFIHFACTDNDQNTKLQVVVQVTVTAGVMLQQYTEEATTITI